MSSGARLLVVFMLQVKRRLRGLISPSGPMVELGLGGPCGSCGPPPVDPETPMPWAPAVHVPGEGLDDDPQIEESFELDAPSGKDGLPAGIQERGYDVLGDLVGDTDLGGCSVGQRLARYRRRKRFCSLFDHGHSAARLGTVPALPRRATAFPRRRPNLLGVNGPPGGPVTRITR